MKQIFIVFLIITMSSSCHNDDLEKLKQENIALSNELSSLKISILEEDAKKKFFGKYINQEKGMYESFDFKGESSVVVTDGFIGFPFATSYERDGEIIRIKTDKSDLMLTIKDSNTLIGDGWAAGTYRKIGTEGKGKQEAKARAKMDSLFDAATQSVTTEPIKFYYTLKDKKSGELIEFNEFPKNWDQKYDYISSHTGIAKNEVGTKLEQDKKR